MRRKDDGQMFRQFAPEWEGFTPGRWSDSVNVRDFIHKNYTPYDGDESFLAGPTEATKKLWDQVMELAKQEREAGGVLDMDTKIISTITSHGPGYLDKSLEKIVGFQTDKPFKRALQPFGGIRMAQQACREYGYEVVRRSLRSSQNTARPTIRACSMPIRRKCALRENPRS